MSRVLSLTLDSEVVASPQQVSCEVASEAVLLSLESGEYFGLNEVGASIWRLIQHPRTVSELRDALLGEYEGVAPDECLQQVLAFLDEMSQLGLVEIR